MKKRVSTKHSFAQGQSGFADDQEALALHQYISALMRDLRIEPGMLAGSVYAGLHANDIGLFEVLSESKVWNVRQVANELSAPITTISSALDRLEGQRLIKRVRSTQDRRIVMIELSAKGRQLAARLLTAHLENCRIMLARLGTTDRAEFLRLAAQISRKQ